MTLKKHIAAHVRDLPKSGIREFFDIVAQEKEVISLGVGEPDFDTPWHIREAAIYALEQGRTHYTSNLGLPELRSAICRYVNKHFGIAYDPRTEVIITVGSARQSIWPCARWSIPATKSFTTSRVMSATRRASSWRTEKPSPFRLARGKLPSDC
jgi:DNA-binding transcriptional MocR family regulator